MSENKIKGNVRLYACGGLGLNIGQHLENFRTDDLPAMARLDITYIDTSESNKRGIDDAYCYLLPDKDGSGQHRKENSDEIAANVLAILQQHKPADLNIVLSSGGGGSGSVFAPSLASELLNREANTIVIMVGDTSTKKYCENTRDTIKSYEGVSKIRKRPVVATYFQNGGNSPRGKVDEAIVSLIGALCVLFSRQNHELDSRDLDNFLYFSERGITSYPARLAQLSLIEGDKPFSNLGSIISVATLATGKSGSSFSEMPDYQCIGYVPETANNVITDNAPIHFVTSTGSFVQMVKDLQKLLDERAAERRSFVEKDGILDADDKPTESGLVL